MTRERLLTPKVLNDEEQRFHTTLRPQNLKEFIGQKRVVEKLKIAIEAAKGRGEAIEHILFYGPPGLGKTTLAHIVAKEMNVNIITSTGPALERPADLLGILTNLKARDVFFIDEIHRLPVVVEEFLYPAMEDYKVDFVLDKGPYAKTFTFNLENFTLIGATTRAGFLSAPLRERFGLYFYLDFYPLDEINQIIKRSAKILKISIDEQSVTELAKRSRGTPRIANRLLRRVRDYAQIKQQGKITTATVKTTMEIEGIDEIGLDELDLKILKTIAANFNGGPVGVEALSATINEDIDTIEDMIEPYLLKIGFIQRTPRGRKLSLEAYQHIKISCPTQKELFS